MKRFWILLASGCVWWSACAAFSLRADDTPKGTRATAAPNAAGIYWQAFAGMPTLEGEQKKVLDAATASVTAPLTDGLDPIVAQYRDSLHELHRARTVAPCDWQLDVAAGPGLLLPHLQKARDLSRVALLRARQRFAAGETDTAVSDVLAVFKMARDCRVGPIMISILVDAAIEKSATQVLAAHLPLLKKEQLDQLATALRELPAASDIASAIHADERIFADWLEREVDAEAAKLSDPQAGRKLLMAISQNAGLDLDAAFSPKPDDADAKRKAELLRSLSIVDVRESLKRLRADYVELGTIAALPYEDRAARIKSFEDSLSDARKPKTREDALRYFSTTMLPSIKSVLAREEQSHIRRQLLEQAIHVQRDGADALQPVYMKKVEYHKTATGFELRCPCGDGVEVLTVGRRS